jgi:glycosyltransferase involved in cell wall biosynthesis
MPDGSPWPLLSIVTPSFRQAQFLEETLRSVLLQGYPNLEYIVEDGGSQDGSVEIIQKYARWMASWVSEKDRGQSHAINKGMAKATGEIVAWINSDDPFLPGAFGRAILALKANQRAALVYSDGRWIDEHGGLIKIQRTGPLDLAGLISGATSGIPQPTTFMRLAAWRAIHGLDESLHMAMDFDLWVRFALEYPLAYLAGEPLAALRFHSSQKTQTRELEGRLLDIAIIERTLRDPRCPSGVSLRGNRNYATNCYFLAELFLNQKRDLAKALIYFSKALSSQPSATLRFAIIRTILRAYHALIPAALQARMRRLRGTDLTKQGGAA